MSPWLEAVIAAGILTAVATLITAVAKLLGALSRYIDFRRKLGVADLNEKRRTRRATERMCNPHLHSPRIVQNALSDEIEEQDDEETGTRRETTGEYRLHEDEIRQESPPPKRPRFPSPRRG